MDRKKVLIITYYWPPSGGIGVHRCLKFAKYLWEFGWEPVIFTAKNAQYPVFDESNYKHVKPGTEVHRIPIFEPFSLFKKVSGRKQDDSPNPVYVRDRKRSWIDEFSIWIRGNLFIPDARAFWIKPAVRAISRYLDQHGNIDAIFSDGPPHTNTRIAYHVSKKFNIPWLADFQDPWTQVDYYKLLKISGVADRIHRKMEQGVFRLANKITIASPSWAEDLQKIGAKDVDVLYYGYDEEDFSGSGPSQTELKKIKVLRNKFVINHAGLLGLDRFPEEFLRVLSDLANEIKGFRDDLLLFFPGEVDYSIKKFIEKLDLSENAIYPGHISKNLAIESMKISGLLLLPLNKAENVKGRLPGKVYEYMRSYTPVLALGPEDSDVNTILRDTGTGSCINYHDADKIRTYVLNVYNSYLKEEKITGFSEQKIQEYDVRNQTRKLADYLNGING